MLGVLLLFGTCFLVIALATILRASEREAEPRLVSERRQIEPSHLGRRNLARDR
jgi:hypothetical protein